MSPAFSDDPMLTRLRALPRATPTPDSAARIRSLSHAALAKRHRPAQAARPFLARVFDGAVMAVCVVYLSGAVAQAWRLLNGLR